MPTQIKIDSNVSKFMGENSFKQQGVFASDSIDVDLANYFNGSGAFMILI